MSKSLLLAAIPALVVTCPPCSIPEDPDGSTGTTDVESSSTSAVTDASTAGLGGPRAVLRSAYLRPATTPDAAPDSRWVLIEVLQPAKAELCFASAGALDFDCADLDLVPGCVHVGGALVKDLIDQHVEVDVETPLGAAVDATAWIVELCVDGADACQSVAAGADLGLGYIPDPALNDAAADASVAMMLPVYFGGAAWHYVLNPYSEDAGCDAQGLP